MFCWSSAGRLRPMRMVFLDRNYNTHQFDLIKWKKRRIRADKRLDEPPLGSKVEHEIAMRQQLPGRTGEWPRYRKAKPTRAIL